MSHVIVKIKTFFARLFYEHIFLLQLLFLLEWVTCFSKAAAATITQRIFLLREPSSNKKIRIFIVKYIFEKMWQLTVITLMRMTSEYCWERNETARNIYVCTSWFKTWLPIWVEHFSNKYSLIIVFSFIFLGKSPGPAPHVGVAWQSLGMWLSTPWFEVMDWEGEYPTSCVTVMSHSTQIIRYEHKNYFHAILIEMSLAMYVHNTYY